MHRTLWWLLWAAGAIPLARLAQDVPAVTRLAVQTRADPPELRCAARTAPAAAPAPPNPDPLEVPTEALIDTLDPLAAPATPAIRDSVALPQGGAVRMAIWGDSHLAANFFTEELSKLLNIPADAAIHARIPATMGRAGVRLPLRQACVSSHWKYEPGYLGGEAAGAPGPGLVNLFSDQPGATLAWDLRRGAQAGGTERVRLLYQQTAAPMRVALGVDGGAEALLVLAAPAGPAVLELVAPLAISQVSLRLVDARFRLHGLELLPAQASPFVIDVFGYPGATVASWKSADLPYLRSWFGQRDYQLVILEFGTNEGNVTPFDGATYRRTLVEAVHAMTSVFPAAACVLIAPGDRGVLVHRSANLRTRSSGRAAVAVKSTSKQRRQARKGATAIDLFVYARIHAEIGRIQAEVASDAGCGAWSMQSAMGGAGAAYAWARQSPPLMAKDLVHFTVAGYQRLAQLFARDMGWTARTGQASTAPPAPLVEDTHR